VKAFLAALLLVSPAAHADLYRWIDPESGSVKFSNVPPSPAPPGVEVVPYRSSPGSPGRKPAASSTLALELRWRDLLAGISQSSDSPASSPEMQQRLKEFGAASAQLDRLDPAGAERRRAEAEAVLQRLLKVEK
jgi:Domain of unknown function (DUF4124)